MGNRNSGLHQSGASTGHDYRQRQFEAIKRMGESVFRGLSVQELTQETLGVALEIFEAKAASFQLYEEKSEALVFRGVANKSDAALIGSALPIEYGVNGKVFRTGKPEISSRVKDCPEWNPFVDSETGYQTESMLTVPIKRPDNSSIGVIQVLNGNNNFDSEDLRILEFLCLQVAQAIENERLRDEQSLHASRMQALYEFERQLGKYLKPNELLEFVSAQILKLFGADAIRIWLFDPQTDSLHKAASQGFNAPHLHPSSVLVGEGFVGRVATLSIFPIEAIKPTIIIEDLSSEIEEVATVGPLRAESFVTYHALPIQLGDEFKGVLEVCDRSLRPRDAQAFMFLETLATLSASAIVKQHLIEELQSGYTQMVTTFDDTLGGLAALLDLRAREPKGHVERVTNSLLRLARVLNVPEDALANMWRGAMLHDIGKIAVPDSILLKAGPLTEEEWLVMRNHPLHILELLWPIEYLRPALDIPCYHHERWDGSGYPHGLSGEQIPLAARIFAVIEAWDIMRCDRPFRAGWHEDKVRAYIAKQSGGAYDPRVVEAFQRLDLG